MRRTRQAVAVGWTLGVVIQLAQLPAAAREVGAGPAGDTARGPSGTELVPGPDSRRAGPVPMPEARPAEPGPVPMPRVWPVAPGAVPIPEVEPPGSPWAGRPPHRLTARPDPAPVPVQ